MIVTPNMIMSAIKEKLSEAFPCETIYENLTPVGFERPSNMVELTGMKLDPLSMGGGAVDVLYQFKITTYCQVDEVHDSHLPTLDLRCMTILEAFSAGYIKAGDRAPKVTACAANTDGLYDYAEVRMTFSLTMDRSEFSQTEPASMMREVNTRRNVKENVI